ncbi:ABC transporter substrate-binding protein [Pseudonocardia zijingensis]|uniref:SsuA/THI5-like domain-containing protein n=1 Tax=Pseudonocardia zijingensis TaxID=153376 RepID=A0ABN1Q2I8_9PSEU
MSGRLTRRSLLLSTLFAAAGTGLAACAGGAAAGPTLAPDAALPTSVPPGTVLRIASNQRVQDLALELSGLLDDLPFTVAEWVNLGAGPDIINAFRAESLDVGLNAGIPPIQAHYQGFDAKIVGVRHTREPKYLLATRPGSPIGDVADFRGARLAFSQGQAQGVVLLRALQQAGIHPDEVQLVPLASTQFLTALQSGQVDVAPLGLAQVPKYLQQYGGDGARALRTDVVDLLTVLWAPDQVLRDPAKAAAIAAFVPLWAASTTWTWENPEPWAQAYYVDTQNLTLEAAREIIALGDKPYFPPSWDEAIAWEQETADLLAQGGFVDPFDVTGLFDRRFEPLAAAAVSDEYRK